MEKKDVAIFLVYLFIFFWPVYFTATSCCVACWLFYTSLVWDVVCICKSFLQWSDVVIKMNLFMVGCFCCPYLDSVSSFWWSIWELKDVWSGFCTSTGFDFPVWSSNIRTFCPGTSGGRSWAVLSWYIFCISCLCFSSSRIWSMLENLGVETLAIKFDLKMRLFKSSAGLRRLWFIGVVCKHSIAKLGSLPDCLA